MILEAFVANVKQFEFKTSEFNLRTFVISLLINTKEQSNARQWANLLLTFISLEVREQCTIASYLKLHSLRSISLST